MANTPEIKGYVEDVNPNTIALTGNPEILIRYYSNAEVSMDVEADSPIDLDTCIIRNGVNTIYGQLGVFNNVESDTFYFSAEDAYGNIGSLQKGVPMVDYQKLTCYIANSRPNASGEMTLACTGRFFNGSFGAVNNTLYVQYRYVETGGTKSGNGVMSVSTNGNYYSAYANLTGLDYQKSYNFEIAATDKLDYVITSTSGVRSVPVFHWGKDDVTFEVPVNLKSVNNSLKITGNGSKWLCFGDDIACSIEGDSAFNMTLSANTLDLEVVNITKEGKPVAFAEYGGWAPSFTVPVSYSQEPLGWYSKNGSVVTVGFRIKATCADSTGANNIVIYGLPFTPYYSAAGGGLCSGAIIQGSNNFQCFVAETNGTITTRVQACDYTSGANLSTSATGCKFPYGEFTLSGTITYVTAQ